MASTREVELKFVVTGVSAARVKALGLADEYVERWTEAAKNERGYVHDAWKPVDPTTRTECTLRVASWLLSASLTAPSQDDHPE